jgi:hypothetical protein
MTLTWADQLTLTTHSYFQFSIASSYTSVLQELKSIKLFIACLSVPGS